MKITSKQMKNFNTHGIHGILKYNGFSSQDECCMYIHLIRMRIAHSLNLECLELKSQSVLKGFLKR